MKTSKNILIAFILNLSFSIFELIGGLYTNSISILSDSFHDIMDALSILISYILEKISNKKPDKKYTYGYIRYSSLGALITTLILITGSIFVIYSSVKRILNPVKVNYNGMILLSILGVIINFMAAYFTKDSNSLNQKSVNLHMLEDVLGWIIVLIGSILMKFTDISLIDSIMSILVSAFIMYHAIKNLISINDLFLIKVPKNINIDEIKKHILSINDVIDIHHIHVFAIDENNYSINMHVVVNKLNEDIKQNIKNELTEHGFIDSTLEFETKEYECKEKECNLNKNKVIHKHNH